MDNLEDFTDFYIEESFNIRWSELGLYHALGRELSEVKDLMPYAKAIKKHISFLETCINFYKKYPDMNSLPYGKNVSWSMIKKEFETEKRPRKSIREILHARMDKHSQLSVDSFDEYYKGRYDEDKELLEELDAKKENIETKDN